MKNLPIFSIRHSNLTFAAAGISCLLIAVLSICMGAAGLSLSELWQALLIPALTVLRSEFYGMYGFRVPLPACLPGRPWQFPAPCCRRSWQILWLLPASSGSTLAQGLAVSLCCALGGAVAGWTVAGISFAGAMAAALLVFLVARNDGGVPYDCGSGRRCRQYPDERRDGGNCNVIS